VLPSAANMSIAEYFTGQTIFLTGATGTVGSVFLEKLLRACNGVKKVFLLVRTKNGVAASERIHEFLQLPVSLKLTTSLLKFYFCYFQIVVFQFK